MSWWGDWLTIEHVPSGMTARGDMRGAAMRIKGRNFILHVGYMPYCCSYGVELAWGRRTDVAEGESNFDDVVRWRLVDEITVRRWRNR